jgi:oxygen-independent coproporphyrinogen III oxidase
VSAVIAGSLLAKYDVPGPRYTSYPTVPLWEATPDGAQWVGHIARALERDGAQGAALYVHIPFCHDLCTFCGCNTRITRSHSFVGPYAAALLSELDLYLQALGRERIELGELHLGGGTPTFLTAQELDALLSGMSQRISLRERASCSIEVDPRVTDAGQLDVLRRHGFTRLSLGVQDFDPLVQHIVNRVQSVACVEELTRAARARGFDNINFDLIYGLPLQTVSSIDATMDAVCRLRPDRVALYGYAHVPWIRPGQRRFTELDVPQGDEKRHLYQHGLERLERCGYREIGFDHFALESDAMWAAQENGTLHRNFMGYTTARAEPLIGLGVSSIGDAGDAYVQNEKDLRLYEQRVAAGELPIHRGHVLDGEDQVLRRHMLRLMTQLQTRWDSPADYTGYLETVAQRLAGPAADGLLELDAGGCRVTAKGRAFLRNICMAFDARLSRRAPDQGLHRRAFTPA